MDVLIPMVKMALMSRSSSLHRRPDGPTKGSPALKSTAPFSWRKQSTGNLPPCRNVAATSISSSGILFGTTTVFG